MYRDNIKQTHRNWPEWYQISHFDPKGQNHGNYETTAKIMCIDVYFVTVMNLVTYLKYIVYFIIVLKYRHKQFSVQYKRDEYKTHYKIESNFAKIWEIAPKNTCVAMTTNQFVIFLWTKSMLQNNNVSFSMFIHCLWWILPH